MKSYKEELEELYDLARKEGNLGIAFDLLQQYQSLFGGKSHEVEHGNREKDVASNVKKYLNLLRDAPEAITKLDIRFLRAKLELLETEEVPEHEKE